MATRLAPSKRPNGGDIVGDDADDGFFAPPLRWQSDPRPLFPSVAAATVTAPTTDGALATRGPSQAPLPAFVATAEDAERAWRHARRAGGVGSIGGSLTSPSSSSSGGSASDGPLQAPVDLYDALVHSVRETQYTLQPPGVRYRRKGEREKEKEKEKT